MPHDLNQMPEGATVVRITDLNTNLVMWSIPNTKPPVWLSWRITDKELQAGFGPDTDVEYDMRLTREQLRKMGVLDWGSRTELDNDTGNPAEAWLSTMEDQAKVRPWLRDPEVMAVHFEALLEGRAVTEAELQGTEWWRTHNDAQRKWMLLVDSDPATARQLREDQRIQIGEMLRAAGVARPPSSLVNLIAENYLSGNWSETFVGAQIRALTEPGYRGVKLHESLAKFGQLGSEGAAAAEEQVGSLVREWLGPRMGSWSTDHLERWASEWKSDPEAARARLTDMLRKQRQALYPMYDENLTYEDIAAPWRDEWRRTLGEIPDETNAVFHRIVRMNDLVGAQQELRRFGMEQGNRQVMADFEGMLADTGLGDAVRTIT